MFLLVLMTLEFELELALELELILLFVLMHHEPEVFGSALTLLLNLFVLIWL